MSEEDAQNPYQAPTVQPPVEAPRPMQNLGIALPIYLLGLTIIHVSLLATFVAVPDRIVPLRAGIHVTLAALSLFILFQRRLAVAAFFLVNVIAIPLHVVLYGSSAGLLLFGFGVLPLGVLALVWNKVKTFR